jgi:xylan 1,4-beta-xylosidase
MERFNMRHPGKWSVALVLGIAALLLFLPSAEANADEGRIVVELQGQSSGISQAGRTISGTDSGTRQPYKFKQERYGTDFHYALGGLSRASYTVEFSFFEPVYLPGQRVFSVTANGNSLAGLTNLDIASKVGLNTAYQVTVPNVATPGGKLDLHFKSSKKEATICNIRLIAAGQTATEINVMDTRHWNALPLRFVNGAGQDLHEVILGRFGSRFMINPTPQLLAWRQSPLGTWTDDLSELALAFRDEQGDIRCLPFTDRYPVFSGIDQEMTLTGVSYVCRDPALPFTATVTLRAPFYPEDVKLSCAPFFYVDVEVSNPGGTEVKGDFMLVKPHRDDNGLAVPVDLAGGLPGYKFEAGYVYSDESRIGTSSGGVYRFWEALAALDDTDFTWRTNLAEENWIWPSPSGYPLPYRNQVYTFIPRGYSGLEWSFTLQSGESDSRTLVLAGHNTQNVLTVRKGTVNVPQAFLYRKPDGPNLTSVEAVVEYAMDERDAILEKTGFFDAVLSGTYLSPLGQDARDLAAVALQNFIINAWWAYDSTGDEWFSVWEGIPCMFHSTIDVEYNDAWFYLYFWPDLLKKLLQQWPDFEKSNAQGKYLSHDMGVLNNATGMAYPHDMPVEENANYVLLLYSHWKTTGDTAFMRSMFAKVRDYTRFIFNCDTDGDGLPDLNVDNTIDQGSVAVQHARNQTYLGVKAMAAYRAAAEMARAQASPDSTFISSCDRGVRLINITLEQKLWLGDHFAVCADPEVSRAEREAYSIYASNGLLYLLAAGLDPGLTEANLERFKQDITSAASKTYRRYGYVHTSVDNENQWVSQNLWRDALGYWLGVPGWTPGQAERLTRYWELQRYFATKKDGGFWDVCDYRDFLFLGTSEAFGLGFGDPARAAEYLGEARLEAGGARGAYALDSAYWQSLGYYPRGTAFFSYISAMARLRLDRASGYLLYDPAHTPGRVPVFSCADWENKRIPVLVFDGSGGLQGTINGDLLPGNVSRSVYRPITGLEARPFSCSPDTGSPRQEIAVSYNVPAGSIKGAFVLDNSGNTIRALVPGASGTTWDGRDSSGRPVPDGTYTVYIESQPPDPAIHIPAATVQVGVNTNLPSPSGTWYLAEGYTGSNATGGEFETWVLIQNPGDQAAAVKVTFMQPGGVNTERTYSVLPRSRFTIHVDAILPDAEVSTRVESSVPVVVERAMYFNGRLAGHDTIGVNSSSRRWYLAEGYTGGDFDEWVLIQNPNDAETALSVQFQTQDQDVVDRSYALPPRSRFTIHVDDILPDAQVSTYVESDQPVVVERAQYLNFMRSGTCSIAARSPSYTWFFAEGYTSEGFEEWLLVQNPQDAPTLVDLTFMQLDGTNTTMQFTVAPRSRYTVPVHQVLPGAQVSARVSSQLPVVAERAMYWKDRSDGHATLGTPTPEYTWFFAEGYTAEGFEEWLLIQNPWDGTARVRLDFMLPGGSNQSMTLEVAGRSRFTINVGAVVGATEVSLKLTSDLPVVGERAMYFRERSGGHCSIGAIE